MLGQGANVNFQHCAGTPLTRAARRGHLTCVQTLLDHGADVNMNGNFNCQTCTALHAASTNGHYEIAKLLLDRGADVHAERDQKSTPLHDAAKFGHPDIAELLLQHGAQINVKNSKDKTPLFLAASEGVLDGLRWVLEAVIEYYNYKGFHYNDSFYPREAVHYLLGNKVKVNTLIMSDLQDLRSSLLNNDYDTIKLILEDRPPGNVKIRHLQLMKVLIEAGSDTEILDWYDSSPLEGAIIAANEECVSFLVKHGAVINRFGSIYGWDCTLVYHASFLENPSILKILLENGGDPNVQKLANRSVLHRVVEERCTEHTRILLHHGAKVNFQDNDGRTPLHEVKTLDCAKLLVEHGADVSALDKCGRTVLFTACEEIFGEGDCIQFLIDHGVDPLKKDTSGRSAFDLAIRRRLWNCFSRDHGGFYEEDDGGVGVVKVLMKYGAELKETDVTVNRAIKKKKLGLAFALLQSGMDINAMEEHDNVTALFSAAENNLSKAIETLLKEGADPHIKCNNMSPVQVALIHGYEKAAELLLEAGAIPNHPDIYINTRGMRTYKKILKQLHKLECQDSEGNTVMHIECYKSGCILDLIEAEADTNVADKQGITPLHIVCFKGSEPHVKLLLENKADPNKKDNNGLTPLHFAAFKGHCDVGAVLLQNGADVKADVKGRTPVHVSAQYGSTSYLELLISHGADVNVRDKLGWTPLHQAERNGCTDCVEMLIEHGADRTIPMPDYHCDSKIPPDLLEHISTFEGYESDDLGFGLFD